ncbi:hypothetical protein [Asticcacaulis sp. YBE204]|uniref:hypothetical protein n=1 Tax=Asticcacaulis sp. YBE204 TaxID=1282363 RepID=UPI0003C3BC39|nr:hypothetical protein [Asticcacaulis sp. YBE204]ESQ76962.1 hypothetical protein AEYBE204_18985 [Asticcacaulis sp. YBE204]
MEPVRKDRNAFIRGLIEGEHRYANRIYEAVNHDGKRQPLGNYIRVVFDISWPDSSNHDQKVINGKFDVGSELLRVKSLLEQSLMEAIEIHDIVVGCVTVRYSLPDLIDNESVVTALSRLWSQRDLYSVTGVSANIGGRSVRAH